jgi:hypothetical protein
VALTGTCAGGGDVTTSCLASRRTAGASTRQGGARRAGWVPPTRPPRVAVKPTGYASYPFPPLRGPHHGMAPRVSEPEDVAFPPPRRGSTTRRGTRRPRSLSSSCSLAALLLPFLFSSRAIEEADGGAEPSNPAASRRVALSRPGADSIRGGFWEGEEFPPVFIFFLFWGPGLCVG